MHQVRRTRDKLSRIFSIKMAFWKDYSCQSAGTKAQSSYRSTASEMHLLFLHKESSMQN